VVDTEGGTDADVRARVSKARTAFLILTNGWNSREIRTATKLKIFNTNEKTVLPYGPKTWRMK